LFRGLEVKLHARIVLLLALSLGAFLSVGIGTIHWVLDPAFERLEQEQAQTNVKRVQKALRSQLDTLDQKLLDWTNWDDTNDFVRNRTPDYVEGNLNGSSLANLDLSFMAFYDLGGEPVWVGAYDPASGEVVPLPDMIDFAQYQTFLSGAEAPVEVSGLWILDSGAYLLTARPILDSQGEGPVTGTLVFGRRLDPDFLAGLREQTEVAFRLEPLPQSPANLIASAAHETGRTEDMLQHSVVWSDFSGTRGLEIVVDTPRSIAAVGRDTIGLASTFLFCSAIVDMLVIGFAVVFLIARPVRKLIARVERIAQSGDLSLRLEWRRQDEIGVLATQFDRMIDKLETSAQHAMAANQAKSHFLANMSHELRTPLNAIIGFSEIIATEVMGPVGNSRYMEYARDINGSAQHLLRIIASILDFSKIEAGKMRIQEMPVDVAEVIGFCRHLLEIRANAGDIRMSCTLAPNLPAVRGDALKLKQAVLNLLSNAVKFTPPGGYVTTEVALRAGDLVIEITDTGVGMVAEQIPLALEPFGQLENGFAKTYDGTGLGLPLARQLIELHGGTLAIESAPGKGTKATITLPAARLIDEAPADMRTGAAAERRTG
jgi:signal transduction histidine kinase